jgi:hypothetical protein
MKTRSRIILFIVSFLVCFNQLDAQVVKNYEAQWKKADDLLQKKNLPKSALGEVQKIYAQAKKEGQDAQVIKSLVYMMTLQQENREDNTVQSIKDIEKEIAGSKEPVASILKTMLADTYWQYLQQNRWKFYNRTNTVNFVKEDIATWTLEDFHKKISELYLQSIKNEALLKQTRLEKFDAIILKGNVRHLRPTLFDLLAHHALDYFKNDERDIKKPAYAFEISGPQAFLPAAEFVNYKFITKDSLSLHHKALLLYQELIAFHLKDEKPDALIDVDIERIQFAYQNSVAENKEPLYLAALSRIASRYVNNHIATQASYLIAAYYNEQGNLYQAAKDTAHRFDKVIAREILEKIVRDSTVKSEGWTNSYNLLREIDKTSFSFELERVNLPQKPFRASVSYKNIGMLNFRLIKADENLEALLQDRDEAKYWSSLLKTKTIRAWQQSLPVTKDYQQHSVEIKIDSLPAGEYILLASPDAQFEKKNNPLGAQLFYVSNISYINQGNRFFVLHRSSGQPLANAVADVFTRRYNYNTSKYTRVKLGSYKTNANGFFELTEKREQGDNGYSVDIRYQNDRLSLDDIIYDYYSRNENRIPAEPYKKIFFFTDRSIYRPGQLVYFKGIVVTDSKEGNNIAVGYKTTIYLRNANNEIADSVTLTTNEFGSFHATFQLPQSGLNGIFTLTDKEQRNATSISVEEYKRPKFFVDFEKIKKTYKVGEDVTLIGTAKAYAGNNIDGAKVSYRVVRQPRFIYMWLTYKWWFPPTESMEIAHGEATTDKDGKFTIHFTAIPDQKVEKKFDPVFDYTIYADITDINGETRSGQNRITAGYKSLVLKVALDEKQPADSMKSIYIRTENMNGEYQPSKVSVTITQLKPEQRLIRTRFWQRPDQFVMSKEEFLRYFPNDEYNDETDSKTWSKGAVVFSGSDSTNANSTFAVNNTSLAPGYYEIAIATKDKDGQEIKDVKYVELYDPKSKGFIRPQYLWTKGSTPIEPGEQTTVEVGSSADHVFLISSVDRLGDTKPNFSFTSLSNEKKGFTYSATEKDRGGFGTSYFFVKDNRFYQYSDVIPVPWTNKQLKIEYATFRDKTLPGSEEKWKVKITGYKNEKVAAEMLASMYDASLDQFKPHSWSQPSLWPWYNNRMSWNGSQNFQLIGSRDKEIYLVDRQFEKVYDELLFERYSLTPRYMMMKKGSGRVAGVEVSMNGAPGANTVVLQRSSEVGYLNISDIAMPDSTVAYIRGDMKQTKESPDQQDNTNIQIRKNFNETAFFFPDLRTDADGAIEFSFTAPEALTKWKLQTLAHTKELAFGSATKELITQKELMVQPNAPRFLRQGDHMEFTAKIVNLSDKEITGQAQLLLIDATTNQSVDGYFLNTFPNQYFTVGAGQSEVVKFPIQVPMQFSNALTWRDSGKLGNIERWRREHAAGA